MTKFVLIVVIYNSFYPNGGGTVTFQEFENKIRCELAMDRVTEMLKELGYGQNSVRAQCMDKGAPK